jgi:hypothetical protein
MPGRLTSVPASAADRLVQRVREMTELSIAVMGAVGRRGQHVYKVVQARGGKAAPAGGP